MTARKLRKRRWMLTAMSFTISWNSPIQIRIKTLRRYNSCVRMHYF